MVGVHLVLEPPVVAELSRRRRRVLTFNHNSTMDIMVMTALWPNGTVAVVKREMLWVPLMGTAMYFLDFLPLDRGNHDRATASLHAAAARVREADLTLMIAPEGTRSRTGELQPFKLGAFHLAAEADAPIVPLAVHGTRELWPRWQLQCNPGTVTVRLLPEQPSGHGQPQTPEAVRERAQRLHTCYEATLAEMRATVPVL
jgi:1-acyl-sn-glycerol-3-phosphate acyltransferase